MGSRSFGAAVRALRARFRVAAVAVSMTIVVLLMGVAAVLTLDEVGRRGVLSKIAELSYQFIVIVLLGTLLKKVIDDAQERRRAQGALRDRQVGFIRRLIDVSHAVELARVLVRANRSVRMWTEQMNERVISAHIQLRDIRHDERTASDAGAPNFASWVSILPEIMKMETYLKALIDEFAVHKKDLSELQREAERDRSRQNEVWERLRELDFLGDLMDDGDGYSGFRKAYSTALTGLRADAAGSPKTLPPNAPPTGK